MGTRTPSKAGRYSSTMGEDQMRVARRQNRSPGFSGQGAVHGLQALGGGFGQLSISTVRPLGPAGRGLPYRSSRKLICHRGM